MMSLAKGFILVTTWLIFVTVSPYPTDLTDNLFYNADLSTPEASSDTGNWLMTNSPPRLDGTHDVLTALLVPDTEPIGNEMMNGDQSNLYEEPTVDFSGLPSEPVDVASTTNNGFVAMNPAGCSANPGKREMPTDLALGIFTCSNVCTAGAEMGIAGSQTQTCSPPDAQKKPGSIMPILPPIVTPWECSEGLKPYCCRGGLQETTGWALGCIPCTILFALSRFDSIPNSLRQV